MANEQNLRPPFSPSEAREQGRKGAAASAQARREKASLRAAAEALLSRKVPPGEMAAALEEMGIVKSDRTFAAAVVAGAVRKAADGNPSAFGQLMRLMGEGVERVEVEEDNGVLESLIAALEKSAVEVLADGDDGGTAVHEPEKT